MATTRREDPITWAKAEAQRLRQFSVSPMATEGEKYATLGDLVPAAQFLSQQAGPTSSFAGSADVLLDNNGAWNNSHAMAALLEGWAAYKEAGMQDEAPFEVRARVEAANDLMDQVDLLLDDQSIHPAAPIVLTGAALEERLRALMAEASLTLAGKPGLDNYGANLRRANVIDGQEAKQVTAWAGLRNRAAHGENLDTLTVEEARIMRDGVNFFLQKHALP